MIQYRYSYGIKCLVNSKLLVLFATFSLVIMLVIIINGDRYTPIILFGAFKRNWLYIWEIGKCRQEVRAVLLRFQPFHTHTHLQLKLERWKILALTGRPYQLLMQYFVLSIWELSYVVVHTISIIARIRLTNISWIMEIRRWPPTIWHFGRSYMICVCFGLNFRILCRLRQKPVCSIHVRYPFDLLFSLNEKKICPRDDNAAAAAIAMCCCPWPERGSKRRNKKK